MNVRSARQFFVRSLSIVALLGSTCLLTHAQNSARKVIRAVEPVYPEQLRERGIGGTVRLKVTVRADGSVGDVQLEDGDPVLAAAAVPAVRMWRYEPAESETTTEVVIHFQDPANQ